MQTNATTSDNVASGAIYVHYRKDGIKRLKINTLKVASALPTGGNVLIGNCTTDKWKPSNDVQLPVIASNGFTGRITIKSDGSITLYNLSASTLPTSTAISQTFMFAV